MLDVDSSYGEQASARGTKGKRNITRSKREKASVCRAAVTGKKVEGTCLLNDMGSPAHFMPYAGKGCGRPRQRKKKSRARIRYDPQLKKIHKRGKMKNRSPRPWGCPSCGLKDHRIFTCKKKTKVVTGQPRSRTISR